MSQSWTCLCFYMNVGPICTHCGNPKEATDTYNRMTVTEELPECVTHDCQCSADCRFECVAPEVYEWYRKLRDDQPCGCSKRGHLGSCQERERQI